MSEDYALRLSDAEVTRYRNMAARAVELEAERWAAAGIRPGASVADVGCGPGAVLAELAAIVGPDGTAVGVEPNAVARDAARAYLLQRGFDQVEVRDGRGDATGLDTGVWDCVMVRHVLVHTGALAPAIVQHLASLLKPGGHLYLLDIDLDAARSSPHDDEIAGQFTRYADFHRARGNDVRIGPHLPVLLQDAGLELVDSAGWYVQLPAPPMVDGGPLVAAQEAMVADGFLDASTAAAADAARRRFAAIPGAFLWLPQFVALGRRPT